MERRLAAILAADMVAYSRLMAADEAGTIERQKTHRAALIDPKIAQYGGRIVKTTGDGMLVEFPSVVDAVQCAVEIQRAMPEREAEVPDDQRIRYRIGINLGDIVIEDDDILGDGVNVAARLEGLSEPEGLCISDVVYQNIQGKLDLDFKDLGEQALKNMERKVRAWKWADTMSNDSLSKPKPEPEPEPEPEAPPLPDKPSIAVLPFTNMSGDPEQEYFSDGITEDIITELSRFKNLFVIARNSTFAFKGQAVDVGAVGAKLGVGHVVEGSVRKAGNRVRVTAQLVEAKTGNHLWAERYDRDLEDIFAVQDELVHEIAAAVPGQLDAAAIQRARRRPVENLTAYDYVLRGEWLLYQDFGSRDAFALFEKAIEIDPQCARAFTRLAALHAYSVFAHGASVEEAAQMARSLAERALDLDPTDPAIQATVAEAYIMVGEHDLAGRHIERAIKLNPNDYIVMNFAGVVLGYLGNHEEGLRWLHKLSQHDPFSGDSSREGIFDISYMARRYEDAIEVFHGWRNPPSHMYSELAAAYAQLDRTDDAQAAMASYERTQPPGFDPLQVVHAHARMCARREDGDHWLDGYRKAGLKV
jgi:TolB-like protein